MMSGMKQRVPKSCQNRIIRTRLLEQISSADVRILVLHGKAGYGKTELARQYCTGFSGKTTWYRLDQSDNDPKQFDGFLKSIFAGITPEYGEKKQEEWSETGETSSFSHILCQAAQTLENEKMSFLLVLDGLEHLENEAILMRVWRMAAELPEPFHLCILTRGCVPDFLSRFVMDGSCLVLDEPELSFSRQEEETLARLVFSEEKGWEQQLEQLHQVLGGWPAGTMLALLFVKRTGMYSGLLDWPYLVRTSMIGGFLNFEMFRELSWEEQDFLIRTADLESLEADTCARILEKDNARTLIGSLLEADILVYEWGERGARICRHPIVELYLENCGDRKLSFETARKAAEFFLEKHDFLSAARQAARIGDTALILRMMEQYGEELFRDGQEEALAGCVRYLEKTGLVIRGKVPARQLAGMPEVLGTAAQYYYMIGERERMEDCLNQADTTFGKENKYSMYRGLYRGLLHFAEEPEKNRGRIHNTLFLLEENRYPLPYLAEEERRLLECLKGETAERGGNTLRVTFFGDFKVTVGAEEKPLSWRTRKGGELFAYMVKLAGKPVGRKQLLAALWNDELPDNAVTMLHNMLYNLRKELSAYQMEDLIEYKDKVYRIRMERVETDLREMDRLCSLADQNDILGLVENQERFKTYWGRYLEDMDGFWAVEDREYYDTRFLKGCVRLGEAAMQDGRPGDSALFFKNAMVVNSYSEELEAALLKCYGAMGNLKQVKTEYERFTALLQKELQTAPGKALRQTYLELLNV